MSCGSQAYWESQVSGEKKIIKDMLGLSFRGCLILVLPDFSPCRVPSPAVPPVVKGCSGLCYQQTSNPSKGKREHELAEIKDLGQIALLDKAPLL